MAKKKKKEGKSATGAGYVHAKTPMNEKRMKNQSNWEKTREKKGLEKYIRCSSRKLRYKRGLGPRRVEEYENMLGEKRGESGWGSVKMQS